MKVILTRPYNQAQETAKLLETMGFEPLVIPLSIIIPVRFDYPDFNEIGAVAITSRNALDFIDSSQLKHKPLFCIGQASYDYAFKKGFTKIIFSDNGSAESLAQKIVAKYRTWQQSIFYPCAYDAAFDLEAKLKESGISVIKRIVYRAELCSEMPDNLASVLGLEERKIIIFYSERSTEIFCQLVKKSQIENNITNLSAIIISPKLEKNLKSLNLKIISADYPNQDSIISALAKLQEK